MPVANYGLSFQPELQVLFLDTYAVHYKSSAEKLARFMSVDLPSTLRTEKYFYPTSVPKAALWEYGDPVPQGNFSGVQWSTTNFRWGIKVEWNLDDLSDDQTRSLRAHVEGLAARMAMIDQRRLSQIEAAATDAELGTVPTASDGAATYATTVGGAARFGVTSGNLLSGSGVTFQQQVKKDYYLAMAQFRLYQDTKGEPYHEQDIESMGIGIQYAPANLQVFEECFKQQRQLRLDATTSPAAAAAESNVMKDASRTIDLWCNPRLTGNDWYITLFGAGKPPIYSQAREAVSAAPYTVGNSDKARDEDIEGLRFKMRKGHGVALPINSIKIDN